MNEKILRQLKEIQIQAENLLLEEEFNPEKLKNFFLFSEELNSVILKTTKNELILELVNEIQNTEFKKMIENSKTVELFGVDFLGLFRKHPKLFFVKDLISFLRSKYASIELLLSNG
ncbi:MAG TPA: hypothetical protein PLL09_07545 [Flavobacterium sp.]|uniref:hypothetical protein n=1 Tax=unclassified Flavobacterium TaxID=196869 RepID=UPI0025C2566C|nr:MULTISPECIES: hypothetical protein [unclassified Flavobacterium]HRE77662.1 hypothetical protein [Flavobacterium sp.]